jgi:hypothetical protein
MKMFDDDNDELKEIENLQQSVKKFEAVANTHKVLSEQVAMLVNMKDQFIPEMIEKVEELVGRVEDGFDTEELEEQLQSVVNQVINNCDYRNLSQQLMDSAKMFDSTVRRSIGTAEMWQDNFKKYENSSTFKQKIMLVGVGVIIGFGLASLFVRQVVHLFV